MTAEDLIIQSADGVYLVTVRGRANFDYAVPLRDLLKGLTDYKCFRFDMSKCETMDSTFMGVLSMLGIRGYKSGKLPEIYGASDNVRKLLADLGVAKLFTFKDGDAPAMTGETAPNASGDRLTLAETVAEAHKTLVEASSENAKIFDAVIRYAEEDVKKLRK